MQEIKIYKNYGVLAAEKRKVYTYGGEHVHATCSDEMTVLVPNEWGLYKNQMGNIMAESPWGWCYEINDVLTDINGHPAFRAMDESGRPHIAHLYTLEELEEKKRKEERKKKDEKSN